MEKFKFNRQYLIAIQYGEQKITEKTMVDGKEIETIKFIEGKNELVIRPNFTIKITVDRGIFASVNKISLDIYNLNKETRNKIYYDSILHGAVYKKIIMYAGYSNTTIGENIPMIITDKIQKSMYGMPLVFHGKFIKAFSYRQGTDIITHIEAFDLPEKNEVDLSKEFPEGTTQTEILEKLAKDLNISKENLKISKDFKFKFTKKKSFTNKTTWDVVYEIVQSINAQIKKENGDNAPLYRMYFDYPNLYILKDNEYVEESSIIINAETGLLSTPIREQSVVRFTSLFEPNFRCGGYVYLQSRTTDMRNSNNSDNFQGRLKVVGFKHSGTISPTVSDKLITEFTCFAGLHTLVGAEWQ